MGVTLVRGGTSSFALVRLVKLASSSLVPELLFGNRVGFESVAGKQRHRIYVRLGVLGSAPAGARPAVGKSGGWHHRLISDSPSGFRPPADLRQPETPLLLQCWSHSTNARVMLS